MALPFSRFSIDEVRRVVLDKGIVEAIGTTTLWELLHEDGIRPWNHHSWIFPVQKIADALGTTVGDLLGEPGYEAPRDLLTLEQRRSLKAVTLMLRDLFDLDDSTI